MNRVEFKYSKEEMLERFSDTLFEFIEYYKHRFQYRAVVGDFTVNVWLGDQDSDIYRDCFGPTENINEFNLLDWSVFKYD